MADREDGGRRRGRRPGRRSPLGRLAAFILITAVGGAGYLTWRYRRATGTFQLDKEKLKTVVSNEVDGAKAGIKKAGRVIKNVSIRTVADARSLLVSVEAWLKERKVSPATREELENTDKRYTREFGPQPEVAAPPAVAEPSAAVPTDTSTGPVATHTAPTESAELVREGRVEFRSGLEHWRAAGEPGSPREQEELALARERFTSAQDILTRAQERAPEDPEIEKLLIDTNRFLYDCLKRLKFDARGDA